MRIAVVDDYQRDRNLLSVSIKEYMKKNHIEGEVFGYSGSDKFLKDFEKEGEGKYAAVFLDIYMDGMDGISLAYRIREVDEDCCIIFVTCSREFAVEGYEVQAFRYMVKPFGKQKLEHVLDGIFRKRLDVERYIEVKEERTMRRLWIRDILMAELQGHYTCIYLLNGEMVKTRITVKELLKLLNDKRFLECYRNLLVNLDFVDGVTEDKMGWGAFCLRGGRIALIQKRKRKQVKQEFADYLFYKSGKDILGNDFVVSAKVSEGG